MSILYKLFALASLAGVASMSAMTRINSDVDMIHIVSSNDNGGTYTPEGDIIRTVHAVDQRRGANGDTPPGQPVAATAVTALDGEIVNNGDKRRRSKPSLPNHISNRGNKGNFVQHLLSGYDQVFAGTGSGSKGRDGSIQGTAYLTYTIVSNSTYDVDACLAFCNLVPQCGTTSFPSEYATC